MTRSLLSGLLSLVIMSVMFHRLPAPVGTVAQWRGALVGVPMLAALAVEYLVRVYRAVRSRLSRAGNNSHADLERPSLGLIGWVIYGIILAGGAWWVTPRTMAYLIARHIAAGDGFKAVCATSLPETLGPADGRDDNEFTASLDKVQTYIDRIEELYLGGGGSGAGLVELLERHGMENEAWRVIDALRQNGATFPPPPTVSLPAYALKTYDPAIYQADKAKIDRIRRGATRLAKGTRDLKAGQWAQGGFGPFSRVIPAAEQASDPAALPALGVDYARQINYSASGYDEVRTTVQTQVQSLHWFLRDAKASNGMSAWLEAIGSRVVSVATGIRDDQWASQFDSSLAALADMAGNDVVDQHGLDLRKSRKAEIEAALVAPLEGRMASDIRQAGARTAVQNFIARIERKMTEALGASEHGITPNQGPAVDVGLPEGFADWTIGDVKSDAARILKLDVFAFATLHARVSDDGKVSRDDALPTTVKQAVLDVWVVLLEGNRTVAPRLRPRRYTREEAIRSLVASGYQVARLYLDEIASSWENRLNAVRANQAPALTVRVLYRADPRYSQDVHFDELKAILHSIQELDVQDVNLKQIRLGRIDQRPEEPDSALEGDPTVQAVLEQLEHVERFIGTLRISAKLIGDGKIKGDINESRAVNGVMSEGSLWYELFNASDGAAPGLPDPLMLFRLINLHLHTLIPEEVEQDRLVERPLNPEDPEMKKLKKPEEIKKFVEPRLHDPKHVTQDEINRLLRRYEDPTMAKEVFAGLTAPATQPAAASHAMRDSK